VASTYGVLASVSRRYAHRIPFLVKLNHNETLSYPTEYDQTLYASVEQAFNMGAVAVGRPSISALNSLVVRLKRSLRRLSARTSWVW
jgi:hypothetical protein